VINYEIPNEPETYVHRVGRTARAGLSGTAFSFCGPDERPLVKAIERLTGKPIPLLEMPDLPELPESLLKADARPLNGRGPDDEGGGWGRKRGVEDRAGGRGKDRPQGGRPDKPRGDQPRLERPRRDKPQRESGPALRAPSAGTGTRAGSRGRTATPIGSAPPSATR
jgi:ATP-dependent RNA helicase RhlE